MVSLNRGAVVCRIRKNLCNNVVVTIRMPCWLVIYLDAVARAAGLDRSKAIREAVVKWLAERGVRVEPPRCVEEGIEVDVEGGEA